MSVLDDVGGLVGSIVSSIVLLVLAVLAFFVTVLIVQAGAGLAGYDPSGDFVVLLAAVLSGSAIVAGSPPLMGAGR